jgi:hypothetical protein
MRLRDLIGIAVAVISATGIVIIAPSEEPAINQFILLSFIVQPLFLSYFIILCVAIVVSIIVGRKYGHLHVLSHVMTTTMLGSLTVMSAKGFSTFIRLSIQGDNQFRYWLTYVLMIIAGATAVLQIRFLNLAMRHFDASVVNPTVFVLFTVFSIAGSLILYKEFSGMSVINIALFVMGCLYTFAGVYLITGDRPPPVRKSFEHESQPILTADGEPAVSEQMHNPLLEHEPELHATAATLATSNLFNMGVEHGLRGIQPIVDRVSSTFSRSNTAGTSPASYAGPVTTAVALEDGQRVRKLSF